MTNQTLDNEVYLAVVNGIEDVLSNALEKDEVFQRCDLISVWKRVDPSLQEKTGMRVRQ